MRYVVTGAAGFIGSHLAGALQRAGHDVLGVDSYTDYYERARKERNAAGIDVLEADLADAALPPILAGADGVFHLAGQPGVRASWGESFELYLRRNVLATASLRSGSRRVAFASSSRHRRPSTAMRSAIRRPEDVTPQPISPYGITKLACEQLVHGDRTGARARKRLSPLFHGLRPTPATGHGVHRDARGSGPSARRFGFGDGGAAAAASRTSATPSPRRLLRWSAAGWARLQCRRRRRGDDERGE
jgi:hypothetical protein